MRTLRIWAWLPLLLAATLACGDDTSATGGSGGSGNGSADGGASNGGSNDGGTTTGFGNQAGDGGGNGTCEPQTFTLQQPPAPQIYLVIDRSGSMNSEGSTAGVTRWDEMKGALSATLVEFEALVEFGLLTYPTDDSCGTSGPQVEFAPNNRAAIEAALNAATPSGGTPTAAALNNAAASLTDLGDPMARRMIILATDGGPNCNFDLPDSACMCDFATSPEYCCTQYPQQCFFGWMCLDDANTLAVITDLHDNLGIDTVVIGISGTSEYAPLLNAAALAGGRPQVGGSTDYYVANDQATLAAALQTVTASAISCQITLESAPDSPDDVVVYVDGEVIERDRTQMNGWDYTDETTTVIELYGAACDGLQDGAEHVVTATFECAPT